MFPPQTPRVLASAPSRNVSLITVCEGRAGIAFTIKSGGVGGITVAHVTTGPGGILQFALPTGAYTIIEDVNGASAAFVVEPGKLTAIFVRNFE